MEVADAEWERIWGINVKAHLYAARAVLPGMLARGERISAAYVSAAGLLTQIGSAPYAVTKHAALALAEWLAITTAIAASRCPACARRAYAPICCCAPAVAGQVSAGGLAQPEAVAEVVVQGLAEERFLILPHPEVAEYFLRKASDYDAWLRGMRRLQASVVQQR